MAVPQRKTDVGPPHFEKFLPPVIKKNYGKWKYQSAFTWRTRWRQGDKMDGKSGLAKASFNDPRVNMFAGNFCGYLRYTTEKMSNSLFQKQLNGLKRSTARGFKWWHRRALPM
jgi:sulfite reductase beta subunit